MDHTRQLIARRLGRLTFGGVLVAGVAYLVLASFTPRSQAHLRMAGIDAARIISTTWLAALVAGILVRHVAGRLPLRGHPGALFAESVMAPTIGIALLLPITLQMPIALLISDRHGFDTWVWASIWVTGLTHVVFALASALRGYQLVVGKPAWTPRTIYVLTVVTSCVPFVLAWGIPPALVALTALPFVPMLRAMARLVARERAAIDRAPQPLPRAVAVLPRG